ncbi:MAG: hypothetical protein ACTSUE_09005 [Promethearchaeota archaeon]
MPRKQKRKRTKSKHKSKTKSKSKPKLTQSPIYYDETLSDLQKKDLKRYIRKTVLEEKRKECLQSALNAPSPKMRFQLLSEYANENYKQRNAERERLDEEEEKQLKWEKEQERLAQEQSKKESYSNTEYVCPKCKKQKCRIVSQIQRRSADEPMDVNLECICLHTWRIN